LKRVLPAAIAIGVGLVTLASFFFDYGMLHVVRLALTDWVVILAGLALLVGLLHLILVHLRKVESLTQGWPYSLIVVVSAIFVLVLGLLEGPQAAFETTSLTQAVFNGVLIATQASLAGLMIFFLVYAATRMMNKRPKLSSVGFLIVVLIVLVPTTAGARGILLGTTLGTLMVGLRVLVGVEWPPRK
jgi:hypothetical protein